MYHILDLEKVYDKEFQAQFSRENELKSNTIKKWRNNPNKHKNDDKGMYSTNSLVSTYYYIFAMMSRIFSQPDTTKFSVEWVPLMEAFTNYYIMIGEPFYPIIFPPRFLNIERIIPFHPKYFSHFTWVLILWMLYVLPHIFQPWVGNGVPKTLFPFMSIMVFYGHQNMKIISIKSAMELCSLYFKLCSMRKPPGFLRSSSWLLLHWKMVWWRIIYLC